MKRWDVLVVHVVENRKKRYSNMNKNKIDKTPFWNWDKQLHAIVVNIINNNKINLMKKYHKNFKEKGIMEVVEVIEINNQLMIKLLLLWEIQTHDKKMLLGVWY